MRVFYRMDTKLLVYISDDHEIVAENVDQFVDQNMYIEVVGW